MAVFKKILLPIDLDQAELTRHAMEAAIEIIKPSAELRLVNVQAMLPAMLIEYGLPDYESEVRLLAEKRIAETAAKIDYPSVSTIVRIGDPIYHEALIEAKEWDADLIVICSNQPTLATYLLGSNAAKIVRHATCSVLVVRSRIRPQLICRSDQFRRLVAGDMCHTPLVGYHSGSDIYHP